MKIKIKRVYESPERDDGCRILVDRLWPRGVKKESAVIDIWLKEIAPSTSLRKEFGHDPARWNGFKEKYIRELHGNNEPVSILKEKMKRGPVTLLYAAKDEKHNQAQVLLQYVTHRQK